MLSVLMFSLTVTVADIPDMSMTAISQQDDPPVRLWLSKADPRLGDRVRVELSTYDLSRGRIVYRYKRSFQQQEQR